MIKIFENEGCIVIDDFLSDVEFLALQRLIQFQDYYNVHAQQWHKAWRFSDSSPFVSRSYFSEKLSGADPDNIIPTQTGIDLVSNKITQCSGDITSWIGQKGKDWDYFSLTTYLYPAGSGLGWHEDDVSFSGAYIFYAHPEWRSNWGGELCVMDFTPQNSGAQFELSPHEEEVSKLAGINAGEHGPEFGISLREKNIMSHGVGAFIMPKPNRIVFLKAGHSHSIKKVDAAAGDNIRCSVTGFFTRFPKG